MADINWRDAAACRGGDPETFFSVSAGGLGKVENKTAKQVCATCPVIDECLQWALDNGEAFGVWGGKTPDERRRLVGKRPSGRRRLERCRPAGHDLTLPDATYTNARMETCCMQCRLIRDANRIRKPKARVSA